MVINHTEVTGQALYITTAYNCTNKPSKTQLPNAKGRTFLCLFQLLQNDNMRAQFEMNIYLIHKRIIQKMIVEVI